MLLLKHVYKIVRGARLLKRCLHGLHKQVHRSTQEICILPSSTPSNPTAYAARDDNSSNWPHKRRPHHPHQQESHKAANWHIRIGRMGHQRYACAAHLTRPT